MQETKVVCINCTQGDDTIVFVKTEDLLPGMCLGKDINFYDVAARSVKNMKMGQRMTDVAITQFRSSGIDGVYIDMALSEVRMISSINQEIRSEAITGIHSLADNFMNSDLGVQKSDVESISNTAEELIDSLAAHKDILVNIADIKMYDDYTYHHSLSVAIMAIAIGMEIGFDRDRLSELCVAGLLHDIGKVSVPIEIINKPGKLTKEEFEAVKMHPVYAAQHLKERELVNDNVYKGIIQHHEKMDGTGYPYKLSGKNIHPYARILAVADVYDALTSNRPYRVPNPPNEAIEYIMAGNETHFDEQVIRAFLRKVAPYPAGSKVSLSNGERACVLKNYPDAPLRPLVSVVDSAKCYNLFMDMSCMNIVITGLIEDQDNLRLINM